MKHMRRILSFLLVMMMVFNFCGPVLAAADTLYEFRVEFDKETVAPGETVTMSVYSPGGPCNGAQIIVHYDGTKLEHVSQELVHPQYKRNVHNAERHEVDFGIAAMEPFPMEAGLIGRAVFRAKEAVGPVDFTYEPYFFEYAAIGGNGNPTRTLGPASITIAKPAAVYAVSVRGSAAQDVVFEKTATQGADYTFTVNKAEGFDYTVTAAVAGQSAALTDNGNGSYTIAKVAGDVVITAEKTEIRPVIKGYRIRMENLTAEPTVQGDTLVRVYVDSDDQKTFNAFDFTIQYDRGLDCYTPKPVTDEEFKVEQDFGTNTVRIVGYGKDHAVGTGVIDLPLMADLPGDLGIRFTAAKVDHSNHAIDQNAPDADISGAQLTIHAVAPQVPVHFYGYNAEIIAQQNPATATLTEDYTFRFDKNPSCNYTVRIFWGGGNLTLNENADGSYTYHNVPGEFTVAIKEESKTFTAAVEGSGKGQVIGAAATATYGKDYDFQLVRNENYDYNVTATVGGQPVALTEVKAGHTYRIPGSLITGNVVVTVEAVLHDTVTVLYKSNYPELLAGNPTTATVGQPFTFTVHANPGLETRMAVVNSLTNEPVEYVDNGDGTFTIARVTCPIGIAIKGGPRTFNVNVTGTGAAEVTAAKNAHYETDFTFTLNKAQGFLYTVHVTVGGQDYTGFAEKNGTYTIPGKDIKGDIVIAVEKTKPAETVEIKFGGNGAADVVGEPKAEKNKPYTFTITKDPAYDYTVSAMTLLQHINVPVTANEDGSYTIADPFAATLVTVSKTLKAYPVTVQGSGAAEITAAATAKPNTDFTFTLKAAALNLYKVTATVAGAPVDVTVGETVKDVTTYTIPADKVTGEIVITAEKTPAAMIRLMGPGAADVEGYQTEQFLVEANKDYTITVNAQEGFDYRVEARKLPQRQPVTITDNGNGTYTIAGKDVNGGIEIGVGKTAKTYDVTVTGSAASDITAEAKATHGAAFTFTLKKAQGYDYTVTAQMSGKPVELTESNGTYTVAKVTGPITVTAEKKANAVITVNVAPYLTVDQKVVQLVTATTTGQNALSYNGEKMFWSEKYNAYCWLVISAESADQVLTQARAAVAEAADSVRTSVDYTGDVNMTNFVDVNDAQLTYDIYNAKYADFTRVSMEKFLRADVNGSKNVDVADATAIVSTITVK